MQKKWKRAISLFLMAAMLLSSVGAYAFSFDDYDNAQGNAFAADYYANKANYYKTDNKLGRMPAYANPHKLYTDAQMQTEGINNFIPEVSQQDKTDAVDAGVDARFVNRVVEYEDAGVMGLAKNFSDHDAMGMAYLSQNFVGASQIRMPYYPIQRCLGKDPATVNVAGYSAVYDFWLKNTDGAYSAMASFYPDGNGTIYYVCNATAPGFKTSGSKWEELTQDQTKSAMWGKIKGKPGSQTFADSNKEYPLTLINDTEYSWANIQQLGKTGGSQWLDSEADAPYAYTNERVMSVGTNGEDGQLDFPGTLYIYKLSFQAGELVELPTPASKGGYGTFFITWSDRASSIATLNSLGYRVNGEGAVISVPEFNPATKEYTINVGSGAAFAELAATGSGDVEKPEFVDFTKGSTTAAVTVTAADGVSKETYTIHFTAPQFDNALAAPDAISYYTPNNPTSTSKSAKVLVNDYHQTSTQTEYSIKLFANQTATTFELKTQYDTSAAVDNTVSAYPEIPMTFTAYNMTQGGIKTWDAAVGDTVKILSSREENGQTYTNVYTIHVGQFDKAYGYNDGNLTLTLDPDLKTSGIVTVNPSAYEARVPLSSDRYPQHPIAFAGEYIKGATGFALPLNDSTRSSNADIKAYHAGDNKYFTFTAQKPGTIYIAAMSGNAATNHTTERGWSLVSNAYKNFTDDIVKAGGKYTGLAQLEGLEGVDLSDSFDNPLGFYRIQYGSTVNGVYRIGDSVTPKNRLDRVRAKQSDGTYKDTIVSASPNRMSNTNMVYRHFDAGEEVQIYTLGSSQNENIMPFIIWDDAMQADSNDKIKNLTLSSNSYYTYSRTDSNAEPGTGTVGLLSGGGLPGVLPYYGTGLSNNYGINYAVEDDAVLGEAKLGSSSLVYSDRSDRFVTSENTSAYFNGATIIRRPKDEVGPLKFDKANNAVIKGSKEQPYFSGAFSGKNGEPYWMSFQVSSGATVFMSAVNGTWYNAPADWTKASDNSLKLSGKTDVYYKHYNAGETVNIPNYGWSDTLAETTTYWDPPVYAVVWDSDGKTNPDALSANTALSAITVNGTAVEVVAEQKTYEITVGADAAQAVLAVTAAEAGAAVQYGDGSEGANTVETFPSSITVTVTAPKGNKEAYTFNFAQGKAMSKLTVSASGGKIMATVGTEPQADWATGISTDYARGTRFVLAAVADSGYKFLYWLDEGSNRIVSTEAEYAFHLGLARSLKAVFAEQNAQTKTVIFKNRNNQVLVSQSLKEGGKVIVPEDPMYMGQIFGGWLKDNAMSNLKEGSEVTYDSLGAGETVYMAGYTKASDTYQITVTGGKLADGKTTGEYSYDTLLSVTLDATAVPSGKKFAYWTKDDRIVSYNPSYSFYMGAAATEVKAAYVDASESVTQTQVLAMHEPVLLEGGKIAFFAERSLESKFTLIESGILLYGQDGYFDASTEGVIKATATSKANIGQYTVRKVNVAPGESWHAKAYMIYLDNDGNVFYAFSDPVEGTYPVN